MSAHVGKIVRERGGRRSREQGKGICTRGGRSSRRWFTAHLGPQLAYSLLFLFFLLLFLLFLLLFHLFLLFFAISIGPPFLEFIFIDEVNE